MKILVVGSGGREHAVIRKLRASENVDEIICAPGNAGIETIATCKNVVATDIEGMVTLAKDEHVDFVIVTPDDPLSLGMVDAMEQNGIAAFGPTAAAARVESSKGFAKEIMQKANVITAKSQSFIDPGLAKLYVDAHGTPTVIKADGLAKGKGVIIALTRQEAYDAIDSMLCNNIFGKAGSSILIEEYLVGTEVSVMCFCDGTHIVPMVSSQDHKRALDGDKGQNTGGMGAFAPSPFYTDEMKNNVEQDVFLPVLKVMREMNCPFKGVLYAGLMLTANGVYVLEFNARLGDPETQVVLPLLEGDLLEIMCACRNGNLDTIDVSWQDRSCAVIIMASSGYPGKCETGHVISGLESASAADTWVIHAGTRREHGKFITAGGRVLGVCAKGDTLEEALELAYDGVEKIEFDGAHYRKDIGHSVKEIY